MILRGASLAALGDNHLSSRTHAIKEIGFAVRLRLGRPCSQGSMSTVASNSAEDQAILQQVPALCGQLGLKRRSPKKLLWQEKVIGARKTTSVPVDYLYVNGRRVTLAKRLQGLLSPEEWKPLLGSALLVRSWKAHRFRKALAGAILIGAIFYASALYIATQSPAPILGTFSSGPRALLFFPATPVSLTALMLSLLDRRSGPKFRQDVSKADLQIAGVLGMDQFLAVLQKIDSMGFKDEERLIPRSFRSRQPSIREEFRTSRLLETYR
jgi:hypothetical protein